MKKYDLIILNEPLNDENLLKAKKLLKNTGTVWALTTKSFLKRELNLIKQYGFKNNLENWIVVNDAYKTNLYYHLTISDKYIWNSIEIKRYVKVPYTLKGENGEKIKVGWDYENGQPKRWTTLGNAIYTSENIINDLFLLISSNENSNILELPTNKELKRDYKKLLNMSTSENCCISFDKRGFKPK